MEAISTLLTEKFIQGNIIDPAKQEIYKTGIQLITADIINISLILIIGILTKSFPYSVIYLALFWTVRRFSGGFHAKTYGVCRCVTVGTYISVLVISRVLHGHLMLYTVIADCVAVITMLKFAPIRHPNKELTNKEIQANKLFSLLTTLLYTVISIILIAIGCNAGLVISLVLLAIAMLMYIGLLVNGKEGSRNGKDKR